jgi:hypothetical protein
VKKTLERGLKLAETVLNSRQAVAAAREQLAAAQAAQAEAEAAFAAVLVDEPEGAADRPLLAERLLGVLRESNQVGGIDLELIAQRVFGDGSEANQKLARQALRGLIKRQQAVNKGGGFYAAVEVKHG